jgi:hypothetical protein
MRCGCVAIGEFKCTKCNRYVEHGERYLLIAENDAPEDERQRICVDCCLKQKYAAYIKEKGEKVLTFFPE